MTARDHARAVELLRCACDVGSIMEAGRAMNHYTDDKPCSKAFAFARNAYQAVHAEHNAVIWLTDPFLCLEAAQRIEDGDWPL